MSIGSESSSHRHTSFLLVFNNFEDSFINCNNNIDNSVILRSFQTLPILFTVYVRAHQSNGYFLIFK